MIIDQCWRGGKGPAPDTLIFVGVPDIASGRLACEASPDLLPERAMPGLRVPDGGRIILPEAGLIEMPLLTRNMIKSWFFDF